MSGLDSDFLALVVLAGLAPNAPDVVGPGGAALPHPVGAAHDAADADADLEGLLALAPFVAPVVPKHEQRSWQHTERARAGKALKRAQQRTTLATAAMTSAESELRIVTALHGSGIASSSKPTPLIPEMASQLNLALACQPTTRGCPARISKQARASATVAASFASIQGDALRSSFLLREYPTLSSVTSGIDLANRIGERIPTSRIHMFCLQWDETSQRLRAFNSKKFKRARQSHAQSALQVMVQHGSWHAALVFDDRTRYVDEPFFVRSFILEQQNYICCWRVC